MSGMKRWVLYVIAEYSLFYRALLQKRPVILRSLLIVATEEMGLICHMMCIHVTHLFICNVHMWLIRMCDIYACCAFVLCICMCMYISGIRRLGMYTCVHVPTCGVCIRVYMCIVYTCIQTTQLFCKRDLWKKRYSAKETYDLKELLNVTTPYGPLITRSRWIGSFKS